MNPNAKLVEFQTLRGEPYVGFRGVGMKPRRFLTLCRDHHFNFSQIANELELSSTTLRKAFLEYAGISPKAWMTQQRVMLSMRLIREGRSLPEVTAEMGYSDYQHMAREFRMVVEFTPKAMLKLLRGLQGVAELPKG
ncbi:MAG: helix-turn-helix domain-containing protein [Verrucomicrobiaceae bacterium]